MAMRVLMGGRLRLCRTVRSRGRSRVTCVRAILRPDALDGGDTMPYEYDQKELQELADLMPPPLEDASLPSSKVEIRNLIEKYGLRCDATFGTNYEEATPAQTSTQDSEFYNLWEEDKAEVADSQSLEPLSDLAQHFVQLTDFGYDCTREHEYAEIYEKAIELHHLQRQRSRNIYASAMWYSKKLEAAEMQDNYEMADKNPIPTFIRAMYTLEEEFEELNSKQYDLELKMQEQARAIEENEYEHFLKSTVITLPTQPGSQYHEIFAPPVKEDTGIDDLPEIDLDDYLHGILPNAKSDKGLSIRTKRSPDAYINEVIFKEDELD